MSPGDAPTAGQLENNSALAGIVTEATGSKGKCTMPYAPLVAKNARYRSSLETGDLYTALTAIRLSSVRVRAADSQYHPDRSEE